MDMNQNQTIEDLETLNEITSALNQAVDVRGALDRALGRLVDLMGLASGWIFLVDEGAQEKWWGRGFRLIGHYDLPPALALDNPRAWKKGCDCQTLCQKDELTGAYNEVKCSRLAEVFGERRGLAIHATTPLLSGGRTLGILNVAAPDWDAFTPRALTLLKTVGSQMGVALERARLYDMLHEQRGHEQAALLAFSNQLLGRLELDDLMTYLVEEIRTLLDVDACALLLPDGNDPAYLCFRAASGWRTDPVTAGRRVPADDRSGSGKVMYTQRPIVVENVASGEAAAWGDWLSAEDFRSAAIVPLIADGSSIGSLVVDSRQLRKLEENELRFLQLMANQAAIALEKARLHHEEIRRHQLEKELSVARQIQLSMLPPDNPTLPGWDFAASYEAARQVGGDFYDFFDLPTSNEGMRRLGLVVADVADKGVPAALFMALSRTTVRNVAAGEGQPAATLYRANELILTDSRTDLFLTAFFAVLEEASGQVAYANAGHNPPLLFRAASLTFEELTGKGMALGVLPSMPLEEVKVEVATGDLLVFYTDGVTEAMNAEMEEFGLNRLKETIHTYVGKNPNTVLDAIVAAVNQHAGEMARWDDTTLVVVRKVPVGVA